MDWAELYKREAATRVYEIDHSGNGFTFSMPENFSCYMPTDINQVVEVDWMAKSANEEMEDHRERIVAPIFGPEAVDHLE